MIMTRLCDLKGSGAQPARCPRRTLLAMSLTCSEPTNLCQSLFLSHSLTHWFSHPFPCTRSLFLSAVSICFAGHFCLQSISPCLPFFFLIFFHLPFAFIFCPSSSSLPSLSLTGPCMHNQTVVFIGNYCNYTIDKQVLVAFIHAPSQPARQLFSLFPPVELLCTVLTIHHTPALELAMKATQNRESKMVAQDLLSPSPSLALFLHLPLWEQVHRSEFVAWLITVQRELQETSHHQCLIILARSISTSSLLLRW